MGLHPVPVAFHTLSTLLRRYTPSLIFYPPAHTTSVRCLYLFFFRQPKQKKSPAINSNSKKRGKQANIPQEATGDNTFIVSEPNPTEQDMLEELVDLAGTGDQLDDTRATEIDRKVSAFRTQAVEEAQKLGIIVSSEDASVALALFLKVAGLAHRLHDSSTLQSKFERLITNGQITTLIRRVTTRWNTDFDCLRSHITMEREIVALIMMEESLKKYLLTEKQWELAWILAKQLKVCFSISWSVHTWNANGSWADFRKNIKALLPF